MSEEHGEVLVLVRTFAKHRGVSIWTVRSWIREGKVAARKDEGGQRWWVVVKKNPVQTGASPCKP
jgi:predicted site-specific integrase-resolvase